MLCFDTNQFKKDHEYPVVLWDHDDWERYQPFSANFIDMLIKLDRLHEENSN